jgi:hypothetical protein
MITINAMKPNGVSVPSCAQIQGAFPTRLHASVVLMATGFAQFKGAAVGDVKYGGQGSRAWSPPV